jgi:hypothetical protein
LTVQKFLEPFYNGVFFIHNFIWSFCSDNLLIFFFLNISLFYSNSSLEWDSVPHNQPHLPRNDIDP